MKNKKIIGISCIVVLLAIIITISSLFGVVYSVDLTSSTDFLDNSYTLTTNPTTFTVASYNVKGGDATKENLTKINNQINSYNVDIAGLQEIDSDDSPRSKDNECITTLTKAPYTNKSFAPSNSRELKDKYGIMTVSKHSILESDRMFLPMPNRFFVLKGEPRVLLRTVVNINGNDIAFYNAHLSFENNVMIDNKEMRVKQLEYILSIMEKDKCPYKILVGDFNLLSFDEIKIFNEKYNMINNTTTNLASYKGDDVSFKCLDNIIFSKNIKLVKYEMVVNDLSDHNMLYATLKIS